jgi:hypothetical protein
VWIAMPLVPRCSGRKKASHRGHRGHREGIKVGR